MSPRDRALAELLEAMAGYVSPPLAADGGGDRAARALQRERAIRVKVWLELAAAVLRDPKSWPAEMLGPTLARLREEAARPLGYEPYTDSSLPELTFTPGPDPR